MTDPVSKEDRKNEKEICVYFWLPHRQGYLCNPCPSCAQKMLYLLNSSWYKLTVNTASIRAGDLPHPVQCDTLLHLLMSMSLQSLESGKCKNYTKNTFLSYSYLLIPYLPPLCANIYRVIMRDKQMCNQGSVLQGSVDFSFNEHCL